MAPRRDVQAAINAARSYLPATLPNNPTYEKVNPADQAIFVIVLTSKIYDRGRLYDAGSTIMQQKLSQIQGVGQVFIGGSSLPAVRVDINPTQLNSYGLGLQDVKNMLSQQNSNVPKGQIWDGTRTADILANDQLLKADYYRPLIVGYHNGAAIKLSDIADVQDSVENIRAAGFFNGEPCITVQVFRQPNANIVETNERIRQALPSLIASIPAGMDVAVMFDRTRIIRPGVRDAERSLLISISARDPGGICVFAEPPRHADSERRRSRFSARHVRRDVFVRLQHRQHFADGAHDLHGLCGR